MIYLFLFSIHYPNNSKYWRYVLNNKDSKREEVSSIEKHLCIYLKEYTGIHSLKPTDKL